MREITIRVPDFTLRNMALFALLLGAQCSSGTTRAAPLSRSMSTKKARAVLAKRLCSLQKRCVTRTSRRSKSNGAH